VSDRGERGGNMLYGNIITVLGHISSFNDAIFNDAISDADCRRPPAL